MGLSVAATVSVVVSQSANCDIRMISHCGNAAPNAERPRSSPTGAVLLGCVAYQRLPPPPPPERLPPPAALGFASLTVIVLPPMSV